jgi:hypothetical protein
MEVETMGLEPTTPCLQIRPIRKRANADELSRQISGSMRTSADVCEQLRMRPKCVPLRPGILQESSKGLGLGPNNAVTCVSPLRRILQDFRPIQNPWVQPKNLSPFIGVALSRIEAPVVNALEHEDVQEMPLGVLVIRPLPPPFWTVT